MGKHFKNVESAAQFLAGVTERKNDVARTDDRELFDLAQDTLAKKFLIVGISRVYMGGGGGRIGGRPMNVFYRATQPVEIGGIQWTVKDGRDYWDDYNPPVVELGRPVDGWNEQLDTNETVFLKNPGVIMPRSQRLPGKYNEAIRSVFGRIVEMLPDTEHQATLRVNYEELPTSVPLGAWREGVVLAGDLASLNAVEAIDVSKLPKYRPVQ